MGELKRYAVTIEQSEGRFKSDVSESKDGPWVKFEDVEGLIKALKFYANENNWGEIYIESPNGQDDGDCACRIDMEDVEVKRDDNGDLIYSTAGLTARKALSKIENS